METWPVTAETAVPSLDTMLRFALCAAARAYGSIRRPPWGSLGTFLRGSPTASRGQSPKMKLSAHGELSGPWLVTLHLIEFVF